MKMLFLSTVFLCIFINVLVVTSRQVPLRKDDSSPFTPEFDAVVDGYLHRWKVPGLAIAVVDGDETSSKVWMSLSLAVSRRIHQN